MFVSTVDSAWRARSGRLSMTWLATPACTAITLIECATTSCNSRAIRSRSSATACRARSSRSVSRRAARSCKAVQRTWRIRRFSPASQATARPSMVATQVEPVTVTAVCRLSASPRATAMVANARAPRPRPACRPTTNTIANAA